MSSIKLQIIAELISIREKDLALAKEAGESTKSLAQSEEFKAESKWDTRGIEAGYLASAQQRRIKEIESELNSLNTLCDLIKKQNDRQMEEIGVGSFVVTETINYFISFFTGGVKLTIDNQRIQVVSKDSPIGKKLIDSEIEYDEFF